MKTSLHIGALCLLSFHLVCSTHAFFGSSPQHETGSLVPNPRPPRQYPSYTDSSSTGAEARGHIQAPAPVPEPDTPYTGAPPSITLPNGNVITALYDGDIEVKTKYGATIITLPNGDTTITVPNGPTTTVDSYGNVKVATPGSNVYPRTGQVFVDVTAAGKVVKSAVDANGSPKGGVVTVEPNGKLDLDHPNSDITTTVDPNTKLTVENPDTGLTTTVDPSGRLSLDNSETGVNATVTPLTSQLFVQNPELGTSLSVGKDGNLTLVNRQDNSVISHTSDGTTEIGKPLGSDDALTATVNPDGSFVVLNTASDSIVAGDKSGTVSVLKAEDGLSYIITQDKDGSLNATATLPSGNVFFLDQSGVGKFFNTNSGGPNVTIDGSSGAVAAGCGNSQPITCDSLAGGYSSGPNTVYIQTQDSGLININGLKLLNNLAQGAASQSQILSGYSNITNEGEDEYRSGNQGGGSGGNNGGGSGGNNGGGSGGNNGGGGGGNNGGGSGGNNGGGSGTSPGGGGGSGNGGGKVVIKQTNEGTLLNLHDVEALDDLGKDALKQAQVLALFSSILNNGGSYGHGGGGSTGGSKPGGGSNGGGNSKPPGGSTSGGNKPPGGLLGGGGKPPGGGSGGGGKPPGGGSGGTPKITVEDINKALINLKNIGLLNNVLEGVAEQAQVGSTGSKITNEGGSYGHDHYSNPLSSILGRSSDTQPSQQQQSGRPYLSPVYYPPQQQPQNPYYSYPLNYPQVLQPQPYYQQPYVG